ncbi:hypothetical protein SAMN04487788_0877 [Microbacterium testaceum StLB037]|uniref:Uncharacterized protein n=1 Tax=Microbacterium testaceum (strain StLB037) TaxID=979556 RepID=A0A1H0MCS8_MICTS|nr:hypothetical protein [Microbacterium testaceum]SDO78243.1 hypothetical protein SAMN04487788_0877 [Microbacterium testaceum StLB037]
MNDDYESRWRQVEASIGKAVVMWSRLEFFIGMTFRASLQNSPTAVGAFLARQLQVSALLEALKIAATEFPDKGSESIRDWVGQCKSLSQERNRLFHGSYADQSDGIEWHPTIIWTSRNAGGEAPAHLEFERFDASNIYNFVHGCQAALEAHASLPSSLVDWVKNADE